jgi:DNA-binding XRE family transcriptional regulator
MLSGMVGQITTSDRLCQASKNDKCAKGPCGGSKNAEDCRRVSNVRKTPETALRQLVTQERAARMMSVRQAAAAGGISNTTWHDWEDGRRDLSPKMRDAVAKAFDWPADWNFNPPAQRVFESKDATLDALHEKVDAILVLLERLVDQDRR